MKLRGYYGKGRIFNSIGYVTNGKIQTGKTLFSSIYAVHTLYNDCFLRSSYSASIHYKPMLQNYGKTAFFTSGTLAWNESNTFQRTLTTTKHGCFFFKNWQEQLMWHKIIISSCNKTFKQVLSFLLNLLYLCFG